MTKRVAALFGLVAFAIAWLVGVWCGHAPSTRLANAALALASGCIGGLGVGVALERIVLARLSEQLRETPAAHANSNGPANAPAPATPREPAVAGRNDVGTPVASGEAQR